jgi:heme-degrading monooxygenase HmoA
MNDSKSHIRVPRCSAVRTREDHPLQHNATSAYVVVDIWRVKPGRHAELREVLTESGARFRTMSGVLSVDYTLVEGDPDRYLVVFRYADAAAREAFVATDELRSTMSRLRDLWDLESPIYRGVPAGY